MATTPAEQNYLAQQSDPSNSNPFPIPTEEVSLCELACQWEPVVAPEIFESPPDSGLPKCPGCSPEELRIKFCCRANAYFHRYSIRAEMRSRRFLRGRFGGSFWHRELEILDICWRDIVQEFGRQGRSTPSIVDTDYNCCHITNAILACIRSWCEQECNWNFDTCEGDCAPSLPQ